MIYRTAYLDKYGRPLLFIQGEPIKDSIPTETDLIEAITGHSNLTRAWNFFGLKLEVVQMVARL